MYLLIHAGNKIKKMLVKAPTPHPQTLALLNSEPRRLTISKYSCPSDIITFWPLRCTYVVDSHVSKKLVLIAAGRHVVSRCIMRCCHAIATPELRYCPVLTRLTSDTGKFSYVELRYVSLPPGCSLAATPLSHAVWRCASLLLRNMMKHNVSQRVRNIT